MATAEAGSHSEMAAAGEVRFTAANIPGFMEPSAAAVPTISNERLAPSTAGCTL